jgi:hypothetical protein
LILGREPAPVYIIQETGEKLVIFYDFIASFLSRSDSAAHYIASIVVKVVNQKVAKENQPHIVVRLIVVKVLTVKVV